MFDTNIVGITGKCGNIPICSALIMLLIKCMLMVSHFTLFCEKQTTPLTKSVIFL